MSTIITYWAAALVILGLLAATTYTSYHWGFNAARLEQSELANEALAKSAQYIIDEQVKLQIVETIITNSKDKSMLKSPILMQSLVSVSKCAGKEQC